MIAWTCKIIALTDVENPQAWCKKFSFQGGDLIILQEENNEAGVLKGWKCGQPISCQCQIVKKWELVQSAPRKFF